MIRKEWLEGTPVQPEQKTISIRSTVDFSLIKLNPNPTMLNRGITKNLEILWCVRASINPICATKGHMLVEIERRGNQEMAHIFRKQLFSFLDKHSPKRKFQLVIKTRIPLADPSSFFHEIRHIET